MKKQASSLRKLSLRSETLSALQNGHLDKVGGAHYSIPAFYTCPECAPPGARLR